MFVKCSEMMLLSVVSGCSVSCVIEFGKGFSSFFFFFGFVWSICMIGSMSVFFS